MPADEVVQAHLPVVLVFGYAAFFCVDGASHHFFRIFEGQDVRQADYRFVIALLLEGFKEKWNRQSIEFDEYRFL